jgi:hypothetical protein
LRSIGDGVQTYFASLLAIFLSMPPTHATARSYQHSIVAVGVGTYTVTVMVVREGYYDETQTIFFS